MSTYVNFVLILSVSVSRTTGFNKPISLKDQLARSLNNVGHIIDNIEDKIDQERRILSQIEYDLNHQNTGAIIDYDTTIIWWDMNSSTLKAAAATSAEELSTTKTYFPKYFVTTTTSFPTLPHHWSLPSLTKPVEDTPFVADLKKTMELDGHGYFTAFLTRAAELMYTKDPADSYQVIEQLNAQCKKYLDDEKFNSLGETLTSALRTVVTDWFPKLTPYLMNQQAGVLHFVLKDKNKTVPKEMNKALDFYDNLFTKEDGQKLFESLEPLYEFPNVNLTAAELSQNMFTAAITPYERIEGKRQQKRLIQLIYMALEDFGPYFRALVSSSIENSENMRDDQSVLSERRKMKNKNKVSQDQLFPSKHPTLLKKTKQQYNRHKKRNYHHHSHEPKHHHSHRNRHGGHRRYLYEREKTRLSSVRSNQPDEAVEKDTNESESSAQYDDENLKAHHQENTHKRQRTKINKKRHNKLKQHRQKRMKHHMTGSLRKKQQNQSFKQFNIQSSEEHSSQYSEDSIKNGLIHKIREVSSYSDEEEHLRNNLYDALRHGNRTINSFRKAGDGLINNKQTLRDLSSETDEEWLFKNNIYKVFEQI